MSRTQFISFGGHGFWAYDVALAVFLKFLIDVAEARLAGMNDHWVADVLGQWRVAACCSDYGLAFDSSRSAEQVRDLIAMIDAACERLGARDEIPSEEIEAWRILPGIALTTRGSVSVSTRPVVQLGGAIRNLLAGILTEAPSGSAWLFGTEDAPETVRHAPLGPGGHR